MRVLLIALCAITALAAGVGATLSAFSDEAANSGNSYQASASSFGLQMATGSYGGNGAATQSIGGAGFQPDVVIIKANTNNQIAVMKTSTMTNASNHSKDLAAATALATNMIRTLDVNGFTVGNSAKVNANGTTYHWTAFKADPAFLKVGTYPGNGGASNSRTGVGFAPEYVAVLPAAAQRANHRFNGMGAGYRFDADAGSAQRVTALGADGFTVGNANEVNQSGQTFHYLAFNEAPGSVDAGSYTGDGTAGDNVSVGFSPEYAMIRAGANREGNHRPVSLGAPSSLPYINSNAITTGITAFGATGFTIGNNVSVNASGQNFYYLAFNDNP